MNLRPAPISQSCDRQCREDEQIAQGKDGSILRIAVNSQITAQVVTPAYHRDRRCVRQRDHQRKDDNGGKAEPPVPGDVPGCDEPALDEKQEEPREVHDSVGGGQRRKRRMPFSRMNH